VIHPDTVPALVYCDESGNIRDFADLRMAGMSHGRYVQPRCEDLIELPEGSDFFSLPQRLPVGIDPGTGEPLLLAEDHFRPGRKIQAVAAFMAPAHTSTYTAAYQSQQGADLLPLFAYTAVGWYDGRFWVAGFRSDDDPRQDHSRFSQQAIDRRTAKQLHKHPSNRLVQHLGICCLSYRCPAARNYFLGRWEAPLPTSPQCNARCLGCISLQPSGSCPSTQERLQFVPTVREILDIAVPHLNRAERPVVSFGQGCEGEPLLQGDLLEASVKAIRKQTGRGTINCNTNASLPGVVERLASAGLDSMRVSLNSARQAFYEAYYRPRNYCFADVRESILCMKKAGRFVSLNYFVLPGFTDSHQETAAFMDLIEQTEPNFIQLRNLNIDPEWYLASVDSPPDQPVHSVRQWLKMIKKAFPSLRFGYYNPCLNP
jgi:wyosine [tRNA(Phe)-imidazoG37] synthetase (radical SAM superfamily)